MPVPDTNSYRLEYQSQIELQGPLSASFQNPTPQARRELIVSTDIPPDPICDIPYTSRLIFDSNSSGGWSGVTKNFVYQEPGIGAPPIIPATVSVSGQELFLTAEEDANFVSGSYRISREFLYALFGTLPSMSNFVVEFDVKLTLGSQFGFTYRGKDNLSGTTSVFFSHTYDMTLNAIADFVPLGNNPRVLVDLLRGDTFSSENSESVGLGSPLPVTHDPDHWYHVVCKVFDNIHIICIDGVSGIGFSPTRIVPNTQEDADFYNYYIDSGAFGFTLWGTSDFSRFYGTAAFAWIKNFTLSTYIPMLREGTDGSNPVCFVDIMQYA